MPNIIKNTSNNFLTYLIFSVCLIAPFSNDEYIPALPDIARSLATTHTQLVMSVFLLGLSISQLFYGPLLDRYGRKPVLIIGLMIFVIASFFTVVANSMTVLLVARFIQGIGACSSVVSVLAIIRDAYPSEQIVKMIALIMGINAICPTLAPIIGNLLQLIGGWRACFALLLVMGIFYLIIISWFLQETHLEKNTKALKLSHLFFNYFNLLKHKHFLGYILTSCFSYASLFCYFAVAPFLLIHLLQIPLPWIGLIIAINAVPLLLASYIATKTFGKLDLAKSILIGGIFIFAGGVIMVLVNIFSGASLVNLVMPMFISAIGIGIIRPSASAGAIKLVDRKIAGSASAMFSFFSFVGAAGFTSFTTKLSYHSILPFAILLTLLGIGAILSAILTQTSKTMIPVLINAFADKNT